MELHELAPIAGSTQVGKRKGRGTGTGNGKTAGRGHKGQKARSAVRSVSASKAARCLWQDASRSVVSITSLQSR